MWPGNLLIFPREGGPYDFIVKLCDFGLTVTTTADENKAGSFIEGIRTFSKFDLRINVATVIGILPNLGTPERSSSESESYPADKSTDLWAAACVLMDACAWACNGREGQRAFRKLRMDELKQLGGRSFERGYMDCFHGGGKPLECVANAAQLDCMADPLGLSVIETVWEAILLSEPHQRMPAGQLYKVLEQRLSPLR